MALVLKSHDYYDEGHILSQNNLTLCKADYFETCWCKLNITEPTTCPYLLRHVIYSSNSSQFCVYHTIRKVIDCFNSSLLLPKTDAVSTSYIYLTIALFIIGILGNGLSIIVLFEKQLRRLSVYRNLAILCALNILYLFAICIRHINNYKQDLRDLSPTVCRLHTFIVAFTGHLCSWQLVLTSIQRVHALLSLESYQTTSWIQTLGILFTCIILPLLIFDGQLLLNYGLLYKRHMCDETSSFPYKQLRRALHFPINNAKFAHNISTRYYANFFQAPIPTKCGICILWNVIDTFVYAIIPFIIILTSSIIIIISICKRRRLTVISGGICHTNQRVISGQDNLSIFLIAINILFLIMTGPFNICLIIQSIIKYFFSKSLSMKIFGQLNEYLRLLQNAYHALSFIFYCVIGNKFRKSAWLLCQKTYSKLYKSIFGHQQRATSTIICCLERKRSMSIAQTTVTSTNDPHKRLLNRSPMISIKKRACTTVIATHDRVKRLGTPL